jgi:hypothetical protein
LFERVVKEEAVMIPAHFAGEHAVRIARTRAGMRPLPVG